MFDGAMAVEGLSMVERQTFLAAVTPIERTTATENKPATTQAAMPAAVMKETAQADTKVTPERLATEPASAAAAAPSTTEIVFVSSDVSDLQTFLTNRPGTEVVILDPNSDGMAQIAATLSGRTDISAIHILSHGQAGQLFLGNSTLNTSSITGEHADELAVIRASLTDNADILIYGCDAGSGTTGQNFIDALAGATGADIAASTDKTGAADRGGDWVLEAQTGRIETRVVLDIQGQADYQGLLAPFSINAATAPVLANGTNVGGPLNGNTATYNNVGTTVIGGVTINIKLVATITSSTAGDTVTFSSAGGAPTMQMGGGTDAGQVNVRWQLFRADNNQPFVADIKIAIVDIDGNKPALIESVAALQTGVVTYAVASPTNLVVTLVGGFIRADGTASQAATDATSMIQYSFANTSSWDITYYTAAGANGRVFNNNGSSTFVIPGAVTVGSALDLDANDSTAAGSSFQTTYIENSPGVAVVDSDVAIGRLDGSALSAGQTYSSATVVLSNAQLGDILNVGALPSGITATIDTSVAGKITVTLSGTSTPANYLSALQAVSFRNTSDAPATVVRTLLVTVLDGATLSNSAASTIDISLVNDAPINTLPATYTGTEDASLGLVGLSILDPDGVATTNHTVTLSVPTGTLTAVGNANVIVTGTGTGSLVLTGTLANVNAYLASAARPNYVPVNNFNGAVVLTMTTSDGGNIGTGGTKTDVDTSTITINPVNDAPVAIADVGAVTGGATLIKTAANGVIQGAPGTDTDVDNATSTLLVSSVRAGAGAVTQGSGVGIQLTGTLGRLTLNANGSYTYVADNATGLASGATATDTFTYTVVDPATAVSNTTTLTITVTGASTNAAPVVSSTSISVNEEALDTPLALAAPTDADGNALTITVTALPSVGAVTLANGAAVTVGQILTSAQLAGLQFDAPLDLLSTTVTSFNYSVNDGSVTVLGSTAITVNPVNDAPVVSSSTITVNEESVNTPLGLTAPSDIDGNALTITVTALPSVGTVTLANGALVTLNQVLTATELAGLRFSAPLDLLATATTAFGYSVNDGTVAVSGTTSITVNTVNDAPVNTVPPSYSTNEDISVALSGLQISDVDSAGTVTVTLSVPIGSGTIAASDAAGVVVTGTGTNSIVLSGTVAQINSYLSTALTTPTYTPASNASGAVTLTMLTNDGSGAALTNTDTDTATINVVAVSDAPTATSNLVVISEDTPTVVTAANFGFADASDAPANSLLNVIVTSLPSAAEGVYRLNGVAITTTQVISAADINAGLLTFTPALNVNGSGLGALSFRVQDNGGTANGGADTSLLASTLSFTITPVNDLVVINGLTDGTVPGTDAQVKESDLSTGSAPAGAGETATGTFNLSPASSVTSLTLGADLTAITLAQLTSSGTTPIVRTGTNGTLTINGYNTTTGVVSYSYTLTSAPSSAAAVVNDSFALVVTDVEGDVTNTAIAVNILDDTPVANADVDEAINIVGNPSSVASGNVVTGIDRLINPDPNNADGIVDRVGADAALVTGVASGAGALVVISAGSTVSISGAGVDDIGTLSLNSDGSYTYTPNTSNPRVSGLLFNESLTDTFTYEITDSDGDKSTATLTITVVGIPSIIALSDGTVAGTDNSVLESDLSSGSSAAGLGETVTGSFFLVAPAGVTSFTVDPAGTASAITLSLAQLNALTPSTPATVVTGSGTLLLTGYNDTTGQLDYQYTLITTPNSASPVTDDFQVSLIDGNNTNTNTGPAKFLRIAIVNDVPVAVADANVLTEGTTAVPGSPATGNVVTSGTPDRIGADGAAVGGSVTSFRNSALTSGTVGAALTGSYGALTLNADGSYSYAANDALAAVNALQSGQSLVDTFDYTITDGDGDTSTASLTITIQGANDAPLATADSLSTDEEAPLVLTLATNDTDVDSSTLTVQSINGNLLTPGTPQSFSVPNGTVAISSGGLVTFTPTLNFTGNSAATSFNYTVQDGNGATAIGTVSIAVTAVNDAPVNSLPASFSTNEDISIPLSGLQISDVDAATGNVTVTLSVPVGSGVISAVADGFVTVSGSGSSSIVLTGSVAQINTYLGTPASTPMYAPASNANGAVTLTMVTDDGGNTGADPGQTGTGGSEADTDTVTINIAPVDDAPTATLTQDAVNDTGGSTTDSLTSNPSPAINGTGAPGDTITLFAPNNTVLGTAVVDAAGNWSIDPSGSYLVEGLNTLTVKATDTNGNQGAATMVAVTLDTLRPSATIVVADTALQAGESSLVTITFNEAVTGLTNADLSIANGTLSNVASADGGITWTATFTPTADTTNAANLISLNNTGYIDAAGNTGTGSTDSNSYAIDTLRPSATIVEVGDRIKTAPEATVAAGAVTVFGEIGSPSTVTFVGADGTVIKTVINDGTALPIVLAAADLLILGDGPVEVTTVTTDPAGNVITSADINDGDFTLDTIAPLVASASLTADMPSDTGILGDAVTSNPGPSVSGTGNPGDIITLIAADGTTLLGTALVSEAGTWSISPARNFLTEGLNILSVRATDPAGNTGVASSIAVTLDRSLPTVVEADDIVRSELFETSTLDPTKIPLRANTSLHVQQTVTSTLLAAFNNPGMRVAEVDAATATELMGAMGDDLFIVMDAVQNEFSDLTDVREHSGKGLEIKQSHAIFVARAVHQQELSNDHHTLVHYAVRTSQLEAAARAAMVQVASNSALVGTTTLFDAFAIGAPQPPQPAVTAVPDVSAKQAKPAAKATTTDSKGAQFAGLEVSPVDTAEAKLTLSRIEILTPIPRRPAGGFSSQIKQLSSDFKPRRVESSLAQTEHV